MPHLVKNIQDSQPQNITCGVMRNLTNRQDFAGMDFAHVTITNQTKKHYHQQLTECYYILKGAISMEIDNTIEHLKPGSLIMIYPHTAHQAKKTSQENAEILVACCPPWNEQDEILIE